MDTNPNKPFHHTHENLRPNVDPNQDRVHPSNPRTNPLEHPVRKDQDGYSKVVHRGEPGLPGATGGNSGNDDSLNDANGENLKKNPTKITEKDGKLNVHTAE